MTRNISSSIGDRLAFLCCLVWGILSTLSPVLTFAQPAAVQYNLAASPLIPNSICTYSWDVAVRGTLVVVSCVGQASAGLVYSYNQGVVTQLSTTAQIPNPRSVTISPTTGVIYVADSTQGVFAINGTRVTNVLNQTMCTATVSFDWDTSGRLLVSCYGNRTNTIFGTVNTLSQCGLFSLTDTPKPALTVIMSCTRAFAVCKCPLQVGYVPWNNSYALACSDGNLIEIAQGGYVNTLVPFPATTVPYSVSVASKQRRIGVVSQNGGVYEWSGGNYTMIASNSDCGGGMSIAYTDAGVLIFSCIAQGMGIFASLGGTTTQILPIASVQAPMSIALDSDGGLFITATTLGLLYAIGASVTTLGFANEVPAGTLTMPDGTLFVATTSGVLSIQGNTRTTIIDSSVCSSASRFSVNSQNIQAVACFYEGAFLINGTSYRNVLNPSACPLTKDVSFNTTGSNLLVACVGGGMSPIGVFSVSFTPTSFSSVNILPTSKLASAATFIAVNSKGVLYVGTFSAGIMKLLFNGTLVPVATIGQCNNVNGLTVDLKTDTVYSACFNTGITRITSAGVVTVIATSSQCGSPYAVAVHWRTGSVFAACQAAVIIIRDIFLASLPAASASLSRALQVDPTGILLVSYQVGGLVAYSTDLRCPATYAMASSGCSLCTVGKSRNFAMVLSDVPSCADCIPGSTAKNPGTADCDVCQPGQYAPTALLGCQDCPVGAYSAIPYATKCPSCNPGYFGNSTRMSVATCTGPCSPGYWCPAGSTLPTQVACGARSVYCPLNSTGPTSLDPGYYSINSIDGTDKTMSAEAICPAGNACDGSGNINICPGGFVQPLPGKAVCYPCPVNWYAINSTTCVPCADGSVSSGSDKQCSNCMQGTFRNSNMTVCAQCPLNTYASQAGVSVCTPCFFGSIAPKPGQAACTPCPGGTEASLINGIPNCVDCQPGYVATNGIKCQPCASGTETNGQALLCVPCSPGTYANATATPKCSPCPANTFSSSPGADTCNPCPADQFSWKGSSYCSTCAPGQALNASHACDKCPLNTYSKDGSVCTPCEAGTIAVKIGSIFCTSCLPGQTNTTDPITGLATCKDCDSGFYSSGGTACTPCDAGYYSAQPTAVVCSACPPGMYSDGASRLQCTNCTAGTFASKSASTICQECSAGTFSHEGQAYCLTCNPGWAYDNSTKQCEACSIGKYSGEGLVCRTCDPGRAAPLTQSVFCTVCSPGFFQPLSGNDTCLPCPPGSAAPGSGGTECTPCDAGSFATNNGSISCSLCLKGTASNITALTQECEDCPAGFYQNNPGRTSCLKCLGNEYSSMPGSITCVVCDNQLNANHTECTTHACDANQQYDNTAGACMPCGLSKGSAAGEQCKECSLDYYTPGVGTGCVSCKQANMDGLQCMGGLAYVNQGYWAFLSPSPGLPYPIYQTVKCPDGFCPRAALQRLNENTGNSSAASGNSSTIDSGLVFCEFPRMNSASNLMCSQCEAGYIPYGKNCASCDGTNATYVVVGLLLSLCLTGLLIRSSAEPSSSALTSVFLYFAQTAALMMGNVAKFIDWFQVVNFTPSSIPSCIAPLTPEQQAYFSFAMPLILIGEVWTLAILHRFLAALTSTCRSEASDNGGADNKLSRSRSMSKLADTLNDGFHWSRYWSGTIAVLLFCYTQVAATAVESLYCVDVGDARVLFLSPTVDCRSSDYQQLKAVVIFVIVFYLVAFPLAALMFLKFRFKQREVGALASAFESNSEIVNYQNGESNSSIVVDAQNPATARTRFQRRWGPLYFAFTSHAWYWQSLILLRRFIFVLVNVLLVQDTTIKFMLFALLNFLSLLVHFLVQPFAEIVSNRADTISYSLLVVISMLLTGYAPPYPSHVQALLFLLVIPPSILLVLYVVKQTLQRMHGQMREASVVREKKRSESKKMSAIQAALPNGSGANSPISTMFSSPANTESSAHQSIEMEDINMTRVNQRETDNDLILNPALTSSSDFEQNVAAL